jgi:hypothetical protein
MQAKQPAAPDPARRDVRADGLGSLVSRCLLYMVTGLFLYVLSIGPVAKLCAACDIPGKHPHLEAVLENIYSPLSIAAAHSPPAGRFLVWYMNKIWRLPMPPRA